MTQTFNEKVVVNESVEINGSDGDAVQLRVEGAQGQAQPLQIWQTNGDDVLAQMTADGRLQIGDQGISTPDALIEASKEVSAADLQRGLNTHGQINVDAPLSESASWSVHELELTGQESEAVSGMHTALRAKLTYDNNGGATEAELRAGDFEAINQQGDSQAPVGQMTGLRGTASNGPGAYLDKAVGVEASISNETSGDMTEAAAFEVAVPVNTGTIDTLYGLRIPDLTQGIANVAIQTGQGVVRVGDHEELMVLESAPSDSPPEDFIKIYPKLEAGVPKLYAKDSAGIEHDLASVPVPATEITITAGEVLAARDACYVNPEDGKAYKIAVDGIVPGIRGIVTDAIDIDESGILRIIGVMPGFTDLTPGGAVWASTTPGGYTQAKPALNDEEEQQAIVHLGHAASATEVMVYPMPIQYAKRTTLLADATTAIEHHPDAQTRGRRVAATASVLSYDSLTGYDSSNRDSDVLLLASTYTDDQCTGGTAYSDGNDGSYVAANAFDDTTSTYWRSLAPSLPHMLGYTFAAPVTIRRYSIQNSDSQYWDYFSPSYWSLEYYDGEAWQVADTRADYMTWTMNQKRVFDVAADYTSDQWRLNIIYVVGGDNYIVISELEMMEMLGEESGNAEQLSQPFQIESNTSVDRVQLWLAKVGDPTGELTLRIETDDNGNPSGDLVDGNATASVPENSLSTTYGAIDFPFNSIGLTASTLYHLVLSSSRAANSNNYVIWGADASSPGYMSGAMKSYVDEVWRAENKDAVFQVQTQSAEYEEPCTVGRYSGGTRDIAVRFDDGDNGNADTQTTFRNATGAPIVVTCLVEMA